MTLEALKQILLSGGGILLLLMTVIQITPIKFNPWSCVGRIIGRAINSEVISKVDALSKDLDTFKKENEEYHATLCRSHILRFGDEILHGVNHSKEHYDQTMIDINTYEEYCDNHPDYKNNVAIATIKHIKHKYEEHLEHDDFL